MPRSNTFQGNPCRRGHPGIRLITTKACVECIELRRASPERRAMERHGRKRRYDADPVVARQRVKNYHATTVGRAYQLLNNARSRAIRYDLAFDLSYEWVLPKLAFNACEASGLPFDLNRKGQKNPYAPSVDRIDATKGYTMDNCRIILWGLNAAFNEWGEDVFNTIVKAYLEHQTR